MFPFVGREKGITSNTNFSTFKYFLKILKSPLKIGAFQNKKKWGGENGMVYPGGENGISQLHWPLFGSYPNPIWKPL